MAGYIRVRDKNPDKHQDRNMKSRIIEAKLKALVGGKPDQAQVMLIRGVIPLYLMLETWRKDFMGGQELHPDYLKVQGQVRNTVVQLVASSSLEQRKASVAVRKGDIDAGFDLAGAIDA